jgi:hypothetical protein
MLAQDLARDAILNVVVALAVGAWAVDIIRSSSRWLLGRENAGMSTPLLFTIHLSSGIQNSWDMGKVARGLFLAKLRKLVESFIGLVGLGCAHGHHHYYESVIRIVGGTIRYFASL